MKAQTEVDGPNAELFETTPARPKADTEPRGMEKGNHGDRPRTGIRSANVRKNKQAMQVTLMGRVDHHLYSHQKKSIYNICKAVRIEYKNDNPI